ncbi:MAG: hypothetical protein FWG79_08230, partial [Bacteroidales bacterium]|nr:hypothetical protein [Bacteroidales bacterium]
MKKFTLILIILASFATKSFSYCPIPQWCPEAPLHQTLCPGDTIETIEFPSVIAKVLIVTWWTDGTRIHSFENPPDGITVSGAASTPLGEREYAWPVSIRGKPTAVGTHHYTVSNTCGVELLHGSITLNASIPNTPGTITFSPTSVCPGDTFTASISAVNGADFYTWTTPASMTADGSDSTTINITDAGTTSGNLAVSVTATNTCGTSSASTANITIGTVPNTPGTITFSPTSVCPGGAFTASIAAVSNATTYNWTTPASMTDDGSDSTTITITNAGITSGTLAISVTATNICGTSSASTANITVNGSPTIGDVTPITDQTTELNTPFANALTISPEPTGTPTPTIQWYSSTTASSAAGTSGTAVSGATDNTFTPPTTTVNADGVYYYAVATNICGNTATANTSGKHTVTIPIPTCTGTPGNLTLCIGAINVASPGTVSWQGSTNIEEYARTISGNGITQVWSGVVTASNCNSRAIFTSGNTVTDCRNSTNGFSGDYFNFCLVLRHAATLCPSPWRVPTCQDFIELDVALGGNGIDRSGEAGTVNEVPIADQVEWYIGATGSGNPASNNIESTWGGSRFTAVASGLTNA